MRNKDRPSLQIYQPGKRRTGNSTTGQDNASPTEYKTQISSENETNEKFDTEKPSSSTSKSSDTRKRSDKKDPKDQKDTSKGPSDDPKKSTNEKRISRYSEKRNKVKEKRDLTDNPVTIMDSNSINKEATDEMS